MLYEKEPSLWGCLHGYEDLTPVMLPIIGSAYLIVFVWSVFERWPSGDGTLRGS